MWQIYVDFLVILVSPLPFYRAAKVILLKHKLDDGFLLKNASMAHHLTESEPVSTMPSWPPLWFHLFHPSPASSPQPHGSLFLENSCTIQPQGLCTVSSICTALTRCLQAFHQVISSVLERGLPQTPDIRRHPLHTHTHTHGWQSLPASLCALFPPWYLSLTDTYTFVHLLSVFSPQRISALKGNTCSVHSVSPVLKAVHSTQCSENVY